MVTEGRHPCTHLLSAQQRHPRVSLGFATHNILVVKFYLVPVGSIRSFHSTSHARSSALTHDISGLVRFREQETVDVSRGAQIADIEATFGAATAGEEDTSTIRHPTKPHLTAVQCYDVLPDTEVWANAYDLFKFSERPGERPLEVCLFFSRRVDFLVKNSHAGSAGTRPPVGLCGVAPDGVRWRSFLSLLFDGDGRSCREFQS